MRYVAAYLLAALSGQEPSAADIEKVLSSVGIESDQEKLKIVLAQLKGKNLEEIISKGKEKLASMPASGGAAPAAAASASAGESPSKKAEEKKEAKKEESDAGSDDDMGFGLFD